MGRIALENITLFGRHGWYESEKMFGGHYELNVYIDTDISKAGKSDDLADTIDYEKVYNLCMEVFEERHNLIESLAYEMAHKVKNGFNQIDRVEIQVSKLHPPLPGQVGRSTVTYFC